MAKDLVTICCVLTPAHRRLFRRNYRLTRALNPRTPIRWQVVENIGVPLDFGIWKALRRKAPEARPLKSYQRYCAGLADGLERTPALADRAVRAGFTIQEVAAELRRRHRDDPRIEERLERLIVSSDGRARKLAGSYHHAFGLSQAIAAASGRFLVILDPDFYVVRPDWIVEVVNHMIARGLGIFGAPWHPFWFNKFRGFPCSHFMVIDRSRIGIAPDDVIPDLLYDDRLPNDPVLREWARADGWPVPDPLRRALTLPALLLADVRQRRLIGRSRDTGYRVHAQHGHKGTHECVTPVIGEMTAFDLKPRVVSPLQLRIDRLHPPSRRYWPRDRALGTRLGFAERGLPSVRDAGWEEFVWRGAPFAFHVRGQPGRTAGTGLDVQRLGSVLDLVRPAGAGQPAAA